MFPILYIHGFNSSTQSHKAGLLRDRMQAQGVGEYCITPELPAAPDRAIQMLEGLLKELPEQQACLVGSSLGGYYAIWLAEHYRLKAVLLNPAIKPYELLQDYLGENVNPYTGEKFCITEEYIDILKGYEVVRPSCPENFLVYLETGDEVLDYRQARKRFFDAHLEVFQGGSHEMVNFESRIDDILNYCDCNRETTGSV